MRLRLRAFVAAGTALLASGCASYSSLSLPTTPDAALAAGVPSSGSGVRTQDIALSTGAASTLTEADVMSLAVIRDPDLKAARLKAGVAQAQTFEAGLLPDPRLAAGLGRGPEFTGFSLGVSENLKAFVVRPAVTAAARARGRQVDLAVLWQEQQAALSAGRLFIRIQQDEALKGVIERRRALLARQYQLDQADFQQSAAAIRKVSADLSVLSDADAQLRQLQLGADAARHELNYLLGLAPEARPTLEGADATRPQALPEERFKITLASLAAHRVDLQALRAGYESQEQRLRAAVRAQFPPLDAGLQWGEDAAEGKHTTGLTVGLGLPIFNGNRGRVAVERATRAALRAAYQARLDRAQNEADEIWQATNIMTEQLEQLRKQTSALKTIAHAAEQQFRSGGMDAGAYVGLETSLLQDEEESIRLDAKLDADHLALNALLGLPLVSAR
ncbi:MAG: TolC family protein [Elusimicrobia bacterium]|nr:TolC family protein [Elusimicrobiota bacterium]